MFFAMLSHYLKIAFRNLRKHWIQSLTGILGIAFAIACLVPSIYWVDYETSYDSFYPESETIYRVYTFEKQSGKENKGASKIIETKLRDQFPSIEASTSLMPAQETCRTDELPHIQLKLIYADNSFFQVFPQTIIAGEAKEPLSVLNNMVLSESMAIRLFGDAENAIGKSVWTTIRNDLPPYVVTAVVKDPSPHTNLGFDALIYHDALKVFSTVPEEVQWQMSFMEVYAKFNVHADTREVIAEAKELPTEVKGNPNLEIRMLPITEVRHGLEANSPFTLNFINLFVISGLLLLIAAIFNFFNLNYDLFRQRTREINLRAVNGATSGQLMAQLLCELFCSAGIAILVGAVLVLCICPVFSRLLSIEISPVQVAFWFALCGLGIIVVVLLLGWGLFWRLVRVSISPFSKQRKEQPVYKRIAVTLQLFVSIVFIVASLVVMRQMNYVHQKDLGLNCENLIQLSGFLDYSGKIEDKLINELHRIPTILEISDASFEPRHEPDLTRMSDKIQWEGCPETPPVFNLMFADSHFAEALDLTMLQGSWWREGQHTKVVLNEEAARRIGVENPIGMVLRMPSEEDIRIMADYEVSGVVKDFHTLSFRHQILPTIFVQSSQYKFNILYIRTQPGQEMETIRQIREILPGIDAKLTDARLSPVRSLYDQLNSSEQLGLKVFSALSLVCLLISLFGVYAVAAASTQRRRKEIAIRKVMGAEIHDILYIFFKAYVLQVVLAAVFALPVIYLVMNNWLQDYAYRTNIPLWLLLGVVVCLIILVLLTIVGQILEAANRNPAEELKRE